MNRATIRRIGLTAEFAVVTGIVLALGCAAVAAAFQISGNYLGTTSQKATGDALTFELHVGGIPGKPGKFVTRFTYHASYTGAGAACARYFTGRQTLIGSPVNGFKGIKIARDKFSGHVAVSGKDHLSISGTFTNHKVTGSFSESFTAKDPSTDQPIDCASGHVSFKASNRGAP